MIRLAFMFLLPVAFGAVCQADVIYTVTLNTTPLVGNSSAPFALDFQLTSGDPTSGIVNSATLSQFAFGTGGAAGTGGPFANSGNASGTLSSSVLLNTSGSSFYNEFSEYFTPGSALSFQLDLTNNVQPGLTPDEFTFQLIDKTSGEISTTDPSGSDSLMVIDLTGPATRPLVYTTNGDNVTITPQLTFTPEPGTASMLVSGTLLIGLLAARLRRRKFALVPIHV